MIGRAFFLSARLSYGVLRETGVGLGGDVEVLEGRRYVRDGNLVTAAGVSAGTS